MDKERVAEELLKIAKELVGADLVSIFDRLKKGQKIKIAFKDIMGKGKYTDGQYHDWIVGRKSISKKYNVEILKIMPADDPSTNRAPYTLMKKVNKSTGEPFVVAAHSDMPMSIIGIK